MTRVSILFSSSRSKYFFVAFCIFSNSVFADTVIFKNGTFFQGQVLSQTPDELVFQKEGGGSLKIDKTRIVKVTFKNLNRQQVDKILIEEAKKDPTITAPVVKQEPKPEPKVEETPKTETPAKAEPSDPTKPKKVIIGRWEPVWRSALVPGWGQFYGGERWTGIGTFALFFSALAYTGSSLSAMNAAQTNYESANRLGTILPFVAAPTLDSSGGLVRLFVLNQITARQAIDARQSYESSVLTSVTAVGALGAIYAIQLMHAVYLGRKLEKETTLEFNKVSVADGYLQVRPNLERVFTGQATQLNPSLNLE